MIQRKQVAILTHGLYSEYHPPELDELITGQLKNPRLMDLREQVALVSSVQAYVMEQIKKRQESAREQEGRKNTKRRCLSAKKLAQLVALSDCVSRTIETAARVGPTLRSLVPLETVEQLLREYREIGRQVHSGPERASAVQPPALATYGPDCGGGSRGRQPREARRGQETAREILGKSQDEIIEADVEKA